MKGMRRRGATSGEIEEIYRERFHAFLLSVMALLRDGEASLDVVQEGFALALRRRGSFRREGSLEAWLWRIVLNVARDQRRAQSRDGNRLWHEAATDGGEADDGLKESLLALPERQRLAVFLRYYADLPYEAIAEVLGVSAGTVGASLNAARQALRRDLEEVRR
jgi:RNA polymerase sigma-70 factor (ECF subfamily)